MITDETKDLFFVHHLSEGGAQENTAAGYTSASGNSSEIEDTQSLKELVGDGPYSFSEWLINNRQSTNQLNAETYSRNAIAIPGNLGSDILAAVWRKLVELFPAGASDLLQKLQQVLIADHYIKNIGRTEILQRWLHQGWSFLKMFCRLQAKPVQTQTRFLSIRQR